MPTISKEKLSELERQKENLKYFEARERKREFWRTQYPTFVLWQLIFIAFCLWLVWSSPLNVLKGYVLGVFTSAIALCMGGISYYFLKNSEEVGKIK